MVMILNILFVDIKVNTIIIVTIYTLCIVYFLVLH
jgi:hypothetical protein